MMLRTFTAYGRAAGSARVRVFDWLDHLQLQADSSSFVDAADNSPATIARRLPEAARSQLRLSNNSRMLHAGTTLISRQASPFSRGGLESRLLRKSSHGVYDFDDAIMLDTSSALSKLWPKSRIWQAAVGAADVVIAGNEYLADRADEFAARVEVIPSCVDPSAYTKKTVFELGAEPKALWLGSPSTEHYLHQIAESLLVANAEVGLRLTVISAGNRSLGDLDRMVDREDWDPATFGTKLAAADFGIMPLPDNEWTRGKCAYKLLQYGAAALPSIGSPVGVNATVLDSGQGLAATTPAEWTDALIEMVRESADSRRARGAAALALVEREFSFHAWADRWRSTVLGSSGLLPTNDQELPDHG